MAEYIAKQTLQAKLNRKKAGPATKRYTDGWNDAILMVKSMIHSEKAADVAQVRHGRWVQTKAPFMNECEDCSVCGYRTVWGHRYNYCPNCGSKMDLEG